MPIESGIPLSVKPLVLPDVAKEFANSQSLAQQRQLHGLQIQEGAENLKRQQRANQEADLEQQDQLKLRKIYQDANGDPEQTVKGAIDAGVSPKTVQSLQQHFADYQQKIAKTKADELPVIKDRDDRMLALHDQALQLANENPEGYAAQYPQIYAAAVKIDPEAAKHLDPNTPPTVEQLKLSQLGYLTHTSFLSQEEEKRRQAAEKQQSVMRPLQVQELQGKLTEQQRKEADDQKSSDATMLAEAAKQGPDALAAGLQRLSQEGRVEPFMRVTAKTKPEEILAIATTPEQQIAAGMAASRDKATQENQAALRRIAEGRLGIEKQHAEIAQKIYDQTYGDGANPALTGVEPKLRGQAISAAQKAADEFAKTQEAAATMKTMIDLARSGNKVAYSYAPTTGVLTINSANGVKRVNLQEIKSYGGAGSAADRVIGYLGKQATGASIPGNILTDMENLHGAISGDAANSYDAKLNGINQNYRSNFKPVAGQKTQTNALSTGHKVGDVVTVGNKKYKVTKLLPDDKFEADEVKQ